MYIRNYIYIHLYIYIYIYIHELMSLNPTFERKLTDIFRDNLRWNAYLRTVIGWIST